MSRIGTDYLFFAGLLTGALIFPLAKLLIAGGIGGFLDCCLQLLRAPFTLLGWAVRGLRNLRPAGTYSKKASLGSTPDENEQIRASSQALRNILLSLTKVIQRADLAATTSNQTLGDVRNSIGRIKLPNDLAEVHNLLMREIDNMIAGNTSLKLELSRSQDNLALQKRQIEELRSAVRMDGLTQVANRAYFDEKLLEMLKHRQQHNDIFSLLLVDVDNFKEVNDKYGHQAGDRILKGVAFNLRSALRESDFLARFGGDEFAILLYRNNVKAVLEVANMLCASQQGSRFLLDGADVKVTLSIGVTTADAGDTAQTLLKRADQALYQVKSEGRNGVRSK